MCFVRSGKKPVNSAKLPLDKDSLICDNGYVGMIPAACTTDGRLFEKATRYHAVECRVYNADRLGESVLLQVRLFFFRKVERTYFNEVKICNMVIGRASTRAYGKMR